MPGNMTTWDPFLVDNDNPSSTEKQRPHVHAWSYLIINFLVFWFLIFNFLMRMLYNSIFMTFLLFIWEKNARGVRFKIYVKNSGIKKH